MYPLAVWFSSDSKSFATMEHAGLRLWMSDGAAQGVTVSLQHSGTPWGAFSADGSRFYSAWLEDDTGIPTMQPAIWSVQTGGLLAQFGGRLGEEIDSVQLDPRER